MRPPSPAPDLSDAQLAARAAGPRSTAQERVGANAAFDELYRRHARRLLLYLASRVPQGDEPGDVAQEVWQRVWAHLPDHFDGRSFSGWLFQIARNCLADRRRYWKLRPSSPPESEEREGPRAAPEAVLIDEECRQRLERCLKELPARQAELVRGRLRGEDYDQLAAQLGIPRGQVHKLFHLAKKDLQACVSRDEA